MSRLFTLLLTLTFAAAAAQTYPIVVVDGFIIIRGTMEDRPINVLLDTGAPGLVFNKERYDGAYTHADCAGINGPYSCATASMAGFSWLGITHRRIDAILSDLSFLEAATGRPIDALGGLSLLNGQRFSIDIEAETLTLESDPPAEEAAFLRFHYEQHLPVITCTINGRPARLGMDTGSRHNHLFREFKGSTEIADAGNALVRVVGTDNLNRDHGAILAQLQLSKTDEPSPAAFAVRNDNKSLSGFAIDGLLGQEFLTAYHITIDPGKQRIWLRPRAGKRLLAYTLMP